MPASRLFRQIVSTSLAALLLLLSGAVPAATPDAREIVRRADEIRFPAGGFQVEVKVISVEQGNKPEVSQYRILSKGNDKTLVMTTYPAADRGQIMLMRDDNLWVFMPKVSQPIRLPLAQRLTGQVANGDLARANFAGDYEPELVDTETIEGRDYYKLDLKAANRQVTYHRVKYWVDRENFRPLKAEFYALSGNLLKIAHYRGYQELGGAVRPTQLIMQDALTHESHSLMEYSGMRLRNLPDKFFTKNYLNKLN